jgi:hypothetical protein
MFKRMACAILAAAAFHAPPAQAGLYLSGNDLYSDCLVPKDNPVYFSRTERCTGFITGVVDATEGLRSLQNQPYCVPSDVTLGQLNEVVINYLKLHSETRNLAASALVIAALADTWHCTVPAVR